MIPLTLLHAAIALEQAAMPKAPIRIKRTHTLDTKTGKLVPIKKKLSRPAEYARNKRQKWSKAAK